MAADPHRTHYENFPVASVLLPSRLREPVAAIYAFARSADDFADEGDLPVTERLALLDAFAQDVVKTRYDNFAELMDYCRRSADPVGRLLLHLFGEATPDKLRRSDAVCSALQLINHWQDVAVDAAKPVPRFYLPQDELARFNVSEEAIHRRVASADFSNLMRFQVDRARALMQEGAPLGRALPGRIGLEIRTIVAGGLRILEKIEAVGYDVFNHRPTLTALDWPRIMFRAL